VAKDQKDKAAEKSAAAPAEQQPQAAPAPAPAQQQQQQQQAVKINDDNVTACYANFCRVSSTPEELILDLGLNPNPMTAVESITVSQRIILNHFTAKRMLAALSMAVKRHEDAFGVLEVDVRKRVKGQQA